MIKLKVRVCELSRLRVRSNSVAASHVLCMSGYTSRAAADVVRPRGRWWGWRHPRRLWLQFKASPAAGRRRLVWLLLLHVPGAVWLLLLHGCLQLLLLLLQGCLLPLLLLLLLQQHLGIGSGVGLGLGYRVRATGSGLGLGLGLGPIT